MRTVGEAERINFHPDVSHGQNVLLTGQVDFGSEPFLVRLGSNITIADGVRFITHDGGARIFRDTHPGLHMYAPINVGSYVFIGIGAIIMPGVTIGDRCVIAAGAIVTRNVAGGTVVAGVPARPLKTTDSYLDGLLLKGLEWTPGEYGAKWRTHLERLLI